MKVSFHKKFKKQLEKLPEGIQNKFFDRLEILLSTPNQSMLNVHQLKGDQSEFMSMNVTGDIRALFTENTDELKFHKIGTHRELY